MVRERVSPQSIAFKGLTILYLIFFLLCSVISLFWRFRFAYDYPQDVLMDVPDKLFWMVFVLVITRTIMLVNTIARSVNVRSSWLRYFLFIVCVLAFCAEIAGCVIFFISSTGCNNAPEDGDSGSDAFFCNDFRWCCVFSPTLNTTCGVNATSINITNVAYCPIRLQDCDPPVDSGDLSWNWVFISSLVATFIFAVMDILILCVSLWLGNGTDLLDYRTLESSKTGDYEDIDEQINSVRLNNMTKRNVTKKTQKMNL